MNNAAITRKVPTQIVHNDIYSRTSDLSKADSFLSTEKAWKLACGRVEIIADDYSPLAAQLAASAANRGAKW